jgi:hypothetical protein
VVHLTVRSVLLLNHGRDRFSWVVTLTRRSNHLVKITWHPSAKTEKLDNPNHLDVPQASSISPPPSTRKTGAISILSTARSEAWHLRTVPARQIAPSWGGLVIVPGSPPRTCGVPAAFQPVVINQGGIPCPTLQCQFREVFLCSLFAEWKSQRPAGHRKEFQCVVKLRWEPQRPHLIDADLVIPSHQ